VYLPDGSVYPHSGRLDFSADVVDPATGAVALRALLPNPDKRLLPGSYVLAVVEGEIKDAAGNVTHNGPVSVRKNITLDRTDNGHWIVTGGLAAGDTIITSGLQRADPSTDPRRPSSMPVTPRTPGQAPAGPAPQAAQD